MAVTSALVVASSEQGVTPNGMSTFRPCPTTPAEVAGGTAAITLADGVARRTITRCSRCVRVRKPRWPNLQ